MPVAGRLLIKSVLVCAAPPRETISKDTAGGRALTANILQQRKWEPLPLNIVRNDITKMKVDAVINAANTSLRAGGGVCGAIFSVAGPDRLQKACDRLAPIQTGEAIITEGFALPAKYIIHTAGPVYRGGTQNEEAQLRSCYRNSLDLAKKNKCESIAFPLISSGIYGYPKEEALAVATDEIGQWLMKDDMDVSLVVFDKTAFVLSQDLLGAVKAFIDENYVDERNLRFGHRHRQSYTESEFLDADATKLTDSYTEETQKVMADLLSMTEASPKFLLRVDMPEAAAKPAAPKKEAKAVPKQKKSADDYEMPAPSPAPTGTPDKMVVRLDEPFSATLFRIIDAKGKTDVEVYKRANLDRKLFSKIRTGKGYMPSKKTVAALAVSLELTFPEARDLMGRAGFAFSSSVVFDVIIEYFIKRRKYDVFEINNVLFEYDQPLLGG